MGNIAAAKQNLIRVLQLDPKDAWAYLLLGNIYFKHERDFGSAERYFASAAELVPDDTYILSSYAGLLAQRGRFDESDAMFERAIAARPEHPNPYLGLAITAARKKDHVAAATALERLFSQPADADARNQPIYAEARRLYADSISRRAEASQANAYATVQEALDGYRARTGIEVQVRHTSDLRTAAATQFAWRYNRPFHVIQLAGGGAKAHLVAHEFEHILMGEASRGAGASRLFATTEETRSRALRAVEKDMRRIRERRRLPASEADVVAAQLVDGLSDQLFNTPLDLLIEGRVYEHFPTVRDAQFVGLARQMADNARIVSDAPARELLPQRIAQANMAMNAALALFVDDLYAGRTAYAAAYQSSGMLQTGRRLLDLYRKLAADGRPGAEYNLVDAWAHELRMADWYTWLADDGSVPASGRDVHGDVGRPAPGADIGHRTAQQTQAMREGGPTNPDYLAQPAVQAAASFYMVSALDRFKGMAADAVFAVAAEIAVIGMGGINYTAGEEKYTLKTLPDEKFSGLQLLCLQYVGFKLTRPDIDPMIPLDDAYRHARAMFDAGGG